jgi:hypothetical protein
MSARQPGLAWEMLQAEQILVSYYGGEAEHNRWDEYLAMLRSLHGELHLRCLVDVRREQPPLARIERLLNVVQGKPWRVAMLSASTAMRFVASSFSLVVRNVRLFAPEELDAALDHIQCSAAEKPRVGECLTRLRAL